jgi:hypothetical protein
MACHPWSDGSLLPLWCPQLAAAWVGEGGVNGVDLLSSKLARGTAAASYRCPRLEVLLLPMGTHLLGELLGRCLHKLVIPMRGESRKPDGD